MEASLDPSGRDRREAPLRIAYMTGEYLRLSPFVFIYREIAALRALGFHVETLSIRGVRDPSEVVNSDQLEEARRTFFVLQVPASALFRAHCRMVSGAPRRYLRALRLAWQTRPPGLRALLRQIAYFAEAGIVAARMQERQLSHLHNHFASSSGTVAMLAAELGGFTFSISEHGPDIFFAPEWWRLDEKFARALFVCCISDFCRSQAMIFTPVDRWGRLHIVHCGVDPSEFAVRHHCGSSARLLFVGRLTAAKGVPLLLQAVAELRPRWPTLSLDIAGDGPDRMLVESLVSELRLEDCVRTHGFQSSEEVRRLLAETDVFVLASFAEGVPVVLMEAMATGVPVVTTQIAGIPELVRNGTSGLVVPPGNVTELARAIEKLLGDPALREEIGQAGRRIVEQEFNSEREGRWLAEIMRTALKGRISAIRPDAAEGRP
jgi:glycosyltransferase involved in cell wall biosynthesis